MPMKTWKPVLCLLLVLAICCSVTVGVAAATYTDSSGTYQHTKISHEETPVKSVDGIVDYIGDGVVSAADEGQGDRGQSYSWAAIAHGDDVYVSTCYNAMGNTLTLMDSALGQHFDPETMTAVLNVLYNGAFYTGEEDGGSAGGVLVKVNVVTGEVKLLMSKATTGENCLFRNACEYEGKLYFCGSVNSLPCIYQVDPETDVCKLVYQGMTRQDYIEGYLAGICTGIRGLCEFNGQLIVSCVTKEGPQILSSTHPWDGQEAFTQIAGQEDLFGYPAFHYEDSIYGGSIWEMVNFNGSLYVSICTGTPENMPDENTMQSFALVRGDHNGEFCPKRFVSVDPAGKTSYTSVISHLTVPLPQGGVRYTAMPNADLKEGLWEEAGFNARNVGMSATETLTTNERVLAADPLVRYDATTGTPGGIGEEDMVTLVLPYATSARDGVLRLGALLETYGTYEMNGIAFSDVDEIWWLETVGGHHWIARRVPDDCYVTMPNQLGIDELDLDPEGYEQLFVWDPKAKEIVGGYRYIISRSTHPKCLSTEHYFRFTERFRNEYLPYTIELGRSFVQPHYQGSRANPKGLFSLDNLWDGLGALVVNNPDMRYFFGKVTMYGTSVSRTVASP